MEKRLNILNSILLKLLPFSKTRECSDHILLISVLEWWTQAPLIVPKKSAFDEGYRIYLESTLSERQEFELLSWKYYITLSHLRGQEREDIMKSDIRKVVRNKYGG